MTDEIIFTKGGTEAINLVASSFLGPKIEPGDEIVLTVMEHHSNIVPWNFLRERSGAALKWVDVADDGSLDVEAVTRAFGPRTKMLAITHMSNVLGTRTPLKEIVAVGPCARNSRSGRWLPGRGAWRGGCARSGCRFLCADQPQALWPYRHRRALWQARVAQRDAALQWRRRDDPRSDARSRHLCRSADALRSRYAADHPDRSGWPPRSIISTVSGAKPPTATKQELLARLRDASNCKAINRLRLFGTAPDKGPILSFELEGIHAHDLATILDREGVAVRGGHHCAQVLMERFETVGTCARIVRALQHARRGGCVGERAASGAEGVRMSDSGLRDLYQEIILDHSRHPRHFGALAEANHTAKGHNPLCGDRVTIYLKVDEQDRIQDVSFEGRGCAISVASASLMTDMLKGRTTEEAKTLMGGFLHLVKGDEPSDLKTRRPRTARSHGRGLGLSDAGEMRDACLARDEHRTRRQRHARVPNERRGQHRGDERFGCAKRPEGAPAVCKRGAFDVGRRNWTFSARS